MKALLKLCVVLLLLLFVLTACSLYNEINVRWNIDSLTLNPTYARVGYTVWNQGKYDLTGVNLEIGVYATAPVAGYLSAWTTPDFSLAQNESHSSYIDINTAGYIVTTTTAVLGVDMDKPNK